jgi:replication factor A1
VPQIKYAFTDLSKLTDLEKDATTDVIGVVKDVGEIGSITGKATQRPVRWWCNSGLTATHSIAQVSKRELTIVDDSNFSCRLTLWDRTAETFDAPDQPVMAFKGVKVGDFGGRSLSMVGSSTMTANPDIPEAHRLRGWCVVS